jgi:hypothetical protein
MSPVSKPDGAPATVAGIGTVVQMPSASEKASISVPSDADDLAVEDLAVDALDVEDLDVEDLGVETLDVPTGLAPPGLAPAALGLLAALGLPADLASAALRVPVDCARALTLEVGLVIGCEPRRSERTR